MPTPLIEKLAKESNTPVEQVEQYWDRAKNISSKKFGKEKSSEYYAYTVSILKNMLGVAKLSESSFVGGTYIEHGAKVELGGIVISRKARSKKRKTDAAGRDWWDRMSREQQLKHQREHPGHDRSLRVKPKGAPVLRGRRHGTQEQADAVRQQAAEEIEQEHGGQQGQQTGTEEPLTEEGNNQNPRPTNLIPEEQEDTTPTTEQRSAPPADYDHTTEPSTLDNLTHIGRGLIHNAVSKSMKKLAHIANSKKETFKGGLAAIKKFSNDEPLSTEDKEHLKDMAVIMMGVTMAAAVAFGPFLPYAGSMAHMYLEQLSKRKPKEEAEEYEDDYEPPVLEEPELTDYTADEQLHLQETSSDMTDWVLNQNPNELLEQARNLHQRGTQ